MEFDNGLTSYDFEFIPSEIQEKQVDLGNNITMWIVLMVISAIGSLVCAKHIKKKFMGK